jgi:Spy/CpxP family protein refolding chaperone
MKKIVLSLLSASLFVIVAQAQDGVDRHHKMREGHHFGMMSQQLKFSDDQKAKMKTIDEDYRNQMAELKKNDNITVKEWKSRMYSLRQDQRSKMQALLSPDQKSQIEKMKTDRQAMREVDAKARMEKMKIKLGLSDEQVVKMNNNRQAMKEKMKALHDNKSLDEGNKMEKMKELRKEQKENMKSILTDEQMKKFEDSRKQGYHKKEIN